MLLLSMFQKNEIYRKSCIRTVDLQLIFEILEQWNIIQVTPSIAKSHEYSYLLNSSLHKWLDSAIYVLLL